MVTVMTQGVQ